MLVCRVFLMCAHLSFMRRPGIIAFIEDHNAIDRIIRHLKLTFAAERPPPHQAQPQLVMAAEGRAEYP